MIFFTDNVKDGQIWITFLNPTAWRSDPFYKVNYYNMILVTTSCTYLSFLFSFPRYFFPWPYIHVQRLNGDARSFASISMVFCHYLIVTPLNEGNLKVFEQVRSTQCGRFFMCDWYEYPHPQIYIPSQRNPNFHNLL